MRYGSIKEIQMPQAYAANLLGNSDNTAYVVESISVMNNRAYPYCDTSLHCDFIKI